MCLRHQRSSALPISAWQFVIQLWPRGMTHGYYHSAVPPVVRHGSPCRPRFKKFQGCALHWRA